MRSAAVRLWIDRLIRLLASAGSPILSAIVGVIRNKWLAVHLDVAGIGILAQVVSAQTWLAVSSGLGLSLPLSRAVGAAEGRGDVDAARRAAWTALGLVAGASAAAVAACLLLAPSISRLLLGTPEHANLIRIATVAVLSIALSNTLLGIYAGRSDLKGPLVHTATGGIACVLATLLLVPRWGLAGATLATALLFPAGIAGLLLVRRGTILPLARPVPRPVVDRSEADGLLRVGVVAVLLSVTDLGTLLALRTHYLAANGIEANGLLQAALALSQQVGAIFYAYFAGYAFGKVSAAAAAANRGAAAASVREYTRRQWRPITLLAAAAIGGAMVASTPILHLLYSHRFDPARPLMACALLGEFCRVGALAWGLGSLPLGGRKLWLRIGLSQPLSLAAAYAVFHGSGAGILSLPWAYAAAGVVTLGTSLAVMSGAGVRPRAGDLAWILTLLAALAFPVAATVRG
jgi:O-antigen/teichoic acid export membrane protein